MHEMNIEMNTIDLQDMNSIVKKFIHDYLFTSLFVCVCVIVEVIHRQGTKGTFQSLSSSLSVILSCGGTIEHIDPPVASVLNLKYSD